jgi:hypothetical protein
MTEGPSSRLPELGVPGRPESRAENISWQPHPLCLGRHVGQQRPGVEEPRVARVVHKRDEVQTGLLSQLGQPNHVMRVLVLQGDGVQIICQ